MFWPVPVYGLEVVDTKKKITQSISPACRQAAQWFSFLLVKVYYGGRCIMSHHYFWTWD